LRKEEKVPLVRIELVEGRTNQQLRKIADAVHSALVETIGIPDQDRFQVITEHETSHLMFDPEYLNIQRSKEIVMIQITMSSGRSLDVRKALFRQIAERLNVEAGIRREDVLINLVEVAKENWSFGNGVAQYAAA
jgi:4-oxalocrotonate tautomerase